MSNLIEKWEHWTNYRSTKCRYPDHWSKFAGLDGLKCAQTPVPVSSGVNMQLITPLEMLSVLLWERCESTPPLNCPFDSSSCESGPSRSQRRPCSGENSKLWQREQTSLCSWLQTLTGTAAHIRVSPAAEAPEKVPKMKRTKRHIIFMQVCWCHRKETSDLDCFLSLTL